MKDVTWRGCPGKEGPPESGRYYAKGMRIDYVLVDRQLQPRVVRAEAATRDRIGARHLAPWAGKAAPDPPAALVCRCSAMERNGMASWEATIAPCWWS